MTIDMHTINPGDTVTLRKNRAEVIDEVEQIVWLGTFDAKKDAHWAVTLRTLGATLDVGPSVVHWAVVDHQPVPVQQVRPGFARVSPREDSGANWYGFIDNNHNFWGEEDGFYRAAAKGFYTVVSYLTVTDPKENEV